MNCRSFSGLSAVFTAIRHALKDFCFVYIQDRKASFEIIVLQLKSEKKLTKLLPFLCQRKYATTHLFSTLLYPKIRYCWDNRKYGNILSFHARQIRKDLNLLGQHSFVEICLLSSYLLRFA